MRGHDHAMNVTILHVADCPNVVVALERVSTAAATLGLDVDVHEILVADESEGFRLGFAGSPTILIEGVDPFAERTADPSLTCRLYRTPTGLDGAPSLADVATALGDAAARVT